MSKTTIETLEELLGRVKRGSEPLLAISETLMECLKQSEDKAIICAAAEPLKPATVEFPAGITTVPGEIKIGNNNTINGAQPKREGAPYTKSEKAFFQQVITVTPNGKVRFTDQHLNPEMDSVSMKTDPEGNKIITIKSCGWRETVLEGPLTEAKDHLQKALLQLSKYSR